MSSALTEYLSKELLVWGWLVSESNSKAQLEYFHVSGKKIPWVCSDMCRFLCLCFRNTTHCALQLTLWKNGRLGPRAIISGAQMSRALFEYYPAYLFLSHNICGGNLLKIHRSELRILQHNCQEQSCGSATSTPTSVLSKRPSFARPRSCSSWCSFHARTWSSRCSLEDTHRVSLALKASVRETLRPVLASWLFRQSHIPPGEFGNGDKC